MSRTYRRDPYKLRDGKIFRDGTITMASTPGWWVHEYMNKPKRRKNDRLCHRIIKGDDPDNVAWPLGSHKPHLYYW